MGTNLRENTECSRKSGADEICRYDWGFACASYASATCEPYRG